jgi:hypothetical protein
MRKTPSVKDRNLVVRMCVWLRKSFALSIAALPSERLLRSRLTFNRPKSSGSEILRSDRILKPVIETLQKFFRSIDVRAFVWRSKRNAYEKVSHYRPDPLKNSIHAFERLLPPNRRATLRGDLNESNIEMPNIAFTFCVLDQFRRFRIAISKGGRRT